MVPTRVRVVAGILAVAALVLLLVVRATDDDPADTATDGTGGREQTGASSPVSFSAVGEEWGLTEVQQQIREAPDCVLPFSGEAATTSCGEERMTGGVAFGDYDADGDDDLYLTRIGAPGLLYRNDGDGFTDVTAEHGLDTGPTNGNGAGWADLENDGYPDLYVTTLADDRFHLFMNDGGESFTEEAEARGAALAGDEPRAGFGVAFGDYDGDGWVDLHTTEWRHPSRFTAGSPPYSRLLRNRGAAEPGYFDDVTEAAGVSLTGVPSALPGAPGTEPATYFGSTFVDLDDDGWQDLLVVGDYRTTRMFWNDGDGTFTDGTAETPFADVGNAMGSTFGDVDTDGDLDWFTTAILDPNQGCAGPCRAPTYTGNRLYRNDGERRFTDITQQAGVLDDRWGWGTAFADLDLDGDLDLVATNGQVYGPGDPGPEFTGQPKRLWINDGEGRFTEVAEDAGFSTTADGKGLAVADLDGDGSLEVAIANTGARPDLYRTTPDEPGRWLAVSVEGTTSTREGWGTVVEVDPGGGRPVLVRHIGVATHFLGQSSLVAHLGLGDVDRVARVTVRFPSGRTVEQTDVTVDQTLRVVEPEG